MTPEIIIGFVPKMVLAHLVNKKFGFIFQSKVSSALLLFAV